MNCGDPSWDALQPLRVSTIMETPSSRLAVSRGLSLKTSFFAERSMQVASGTSRSWGA